MTPEEALAFAREQFELGTFQLDCIAGNTNRIVCAELAAIASAHFAAGQLALAIAAAEKEAANQTQEGS